METIIKKTIEIMETENVSFTDALTSVLDKYDGSEELTFNKILKYFFESDLPKKAFTKKQQITDSAWETIDMGKLDIKPVSLTLNSKKPKNAEETHKLLKPIISPDMYSPLRGIYYDTEHNRMVACDSLVLAAIPTILHGKSKIVDVNMEEINETYPDYVSITPDINSYKERAVISKDKINDFMYCLNGVVHANKFLNHTPILLKLKFKDNEILFDPMLLLKLLKVLYKTGGVNGLRFQYYGSNRAMTVYNIGSKAYGLIMPMIGKKIVGYAEIDLALFV